MTTEQHILRIDRKLTALLNKEKPKETWVMAEEIRTLTGWDAKTLRRARRLNYLSYRKRTAKSFVYLLESLPNQFIRHGTAV